MRPIKTEDCIFFQLSRVSRAGARHWKKKVAEFGVTSAQALTLMFLSEEDQITSRDLGSKIEFDSATLTGLLDRLENGNFIEKKSNPGDGRAILICLTPKGRDTADQIREMVEPANQTFLSGLTLEEGLILRSLLKKVV
ncbi:MarR family winged helix-turn-helix transcriptional regulator [Desulfospira joergensenii]|uniref:MarR family winged helix-turn-helix transcriptional regulator n=1 Tax=Desulfospira joergensenii TaxID=53329 RepID=UPI001377FFA4|nr:MarR family transcriptional regulator [Desulfospira joergensenii]